MIGNYTRELDCDGGHNSPKRRSSSLRAMVENRQLTIPFISSTVVEENWTRLLAKLGQCSARGLDYYCLLIDEHSSSYVSFRKANYGQSFNRAACTSPDITGKEYLQALGGRCTSVLNSDSDIDVSSHKSMASEFYSSYGDDPIEGTQVECHSSMNILQVEMRQRPLFLLFLSSLLPVIKRYKWIATTRTLQCKHTTTARSHLT